MNTKRPDPCVSCKTGPKVYELSGGYEIRCECGVTCGCYGTGPFIGLRKDAIKLWDRINKKFKEKSQKSEKK